MFSIGKIGYQAASALAAVGLTAYAVGIHEHETVSQADVTAIVIFGGIVLFSARRLAAITTPLAFLIIGLPAMYISYLWSEVTGSDSDGDGASSLYEKYERHTLFAARAKALSEDNATLYRHVRLRERRARSDAETRQWGLALLLLVLAELSFVEGSTVDSLLSLLSLLGDAPLTGVAMAIKTTLFLACLTAFAAFYRFATTDSSADTIWLRLPPSTTDTKQRATVRRVWTEGASRAEA